MHKNPWKEWFLFTKRDRNAAAILLFIICLIILLPYLVPAKRAAIHIDTALQAELDGYMQDHPRTNDQQVYIATRDTVINGTVKRELFFFDPNTLPADGFSKLGLSQKIIHTLINYRSKGGYFRIPEDIRKIYGLSKADADRLVPYIRIASTNNRQTEEPRHEKAFIPAQTNQYKKININTATVEDWKAFPGIGDVIANRIIKFRTSIGGFKTAEQVGKTYGLSDSVFQMIKPYLYTADSTAATH